MSRVLFMPLRISLRATTKIPIEADDLSPDRLRELSLAQIERLSLAHGNQTAAWGEFFSLRGSAADERIELEGEMSGVHGIGARMNRGEIRAAGNVGRRLGCEMTGGEIHVAGNAGDWAGGEMHGGLIHVRGDAGDLTGAAYRGDQRGMTGGTIIVDGAIGQEAGHTMRRGLIVAGSCRDFVGINMIAGTIVVAGECGARPAAGMRRGTLLLLSRSSSPLLPTFREACRFRPTFLSILFRRLTQLGAKPPTPAADAEFLLFHGDLNAEGRGEILRLATD